MGPDELAVIGGLLVGGAFGAVGQRTGFCLTSGIKELLAGDGRKARAFALALVTALLGSQLLEAVGLVSLSRSVYLQAGMAPLLVAAGGLLFGYGMVAANGCGARSLVLLASGNLRAFVVLVCLGIAGLVTLTGVLGSVRLELVSLAAAELAFHPPTLPGWVASLGPDLEVARLVACLLVAVPVLAWIFGSAAFRTSPGNWLAGPAIGGTIVAGWLVTGQLGADEFEPVPVESLTFVAPVGQGIQYLMLATGMRADFGIAVVGGVLLGAALASTLSHGFRLESFATPGRMLRSMAGGTLMGIGGALAFGCSIGQGLTGMSTLSLGSFLALTGILAGALLALRGPLRLPLL